MNKLLFAALVPLLGFSEAFASTVNLAVGKKCEFSDLTNYGYCNDPQDEWQLTDGFYRTAKDAGGAMWMHKETVGWCRKTGVRSITVDLGQVYDIGGFSCNMAGGFACVNWPASIKMYAGDDGRSWRYAGDLWAKSIAASGAPAPNRYSVYRAVSSDMPCRGRYVMFLIEQEPFTFLDEIEVYPAAPGTKIPQSRIVKDPRAHHFAELARRHIREDAEKIRKAAVNLSVAERTKLEKGLVAALVRSEEFEVGDIGRFETLIPFCPAHAEVFRENSRLMRAAGISAPALWTNSRWENLDPLTIPSRDSMRSDVLRLEMMRGERRAFTVNIANPGIDAFDCSVSLEGFGRDLKTELAEVLYSETVKFETVASALRFVPEGKGLSCKVLAGTSLQVWVSVVSPASNAGRYRGRIVFGLASGKRLEREVEVLVHDLEMPSRPRMHLGGWDYSDTHRKDPAVMAESRRQMRRIGVDTPFATNRVLPQGPKFGEDGTLLNPDKLDHGWWDAWVTLWPDARQFAVFANPSLDKFYGEKVGTPRFEKMVGEYYRAFYRHAVEGGLGNRRIVLHLVDEPSLQRLVPGIIAWEKAIRRGCPQICIMVNPTFHRPQEVAGEMFSGADVLCPQMWEMHKGGYVKFYADRALKGGQETWIYSCNGPSRLLSPVSYYLAQAYLAFQMGACGTFFWQFGDGAGKLGSWQAYGQRHNESSPYFAAPYRAIPAKQGEAIHESLEDYEYLCMLSERIRAAKSAGRDVGKYERILAGAPRLVLGQASDGSEDFCLSEPEGWNEFKRHDATEKARLSVLRALADLDSSLKGARR